MVALDFGDVKNGSGLSKVDEHMKKKSYVVGCVPTQEDINLFRAIGCCPSASDFPYGARWFRHIASFTEAERNKWPGQKVSPKEDDDEFDLFGAETPAESAAREAMKSANKKDEKKKKVVISKSTLVIEVKPQSLEINLDEVEKAVREIKMDGLEWSSASKKVPIAFGLQKLQMGCIIVDDLVATDDIIEQIECIGLTQEEIVKYLKQRETGEDEDEDENEEGRGFVQSAEIVSFQKL